VNTTEERPEGGSTNLPGDMAEPNRGSIWAGILFVAACHIGAVSLGFLVDAISRNSSAIGVLVLCGIGLVQLAYVPTLAVIHGRRGETRTRNGIRIAARITFLLNATCFGVALGSLSFH
jgi:hypothetical protein